MAGDEIREPPRLAVDTTDEERDKKWVDKENKHLFRLAMVSISSKHYVVLEKSCHQGKEISRWLGVRSSSGVQPDMLHLPLSAPKHGW